MIKLVNDWKTHLKHAWSIRLAAIGLLFQLIEFVNNAGIMNVWNTMPDGVRQIMPPWMNQAVSALLFGAAIFARLIPQKRLSGGSDGTV